MQGLSDKSIWENKDKKYLLKNIELCFNFKVCLYLRLSAVYTRKSTLHFSIYPIFAFIILINSLAGPLSVSLES